MYNDFDLIQHHFDGNDDIVIYPIADVHLGAAEHMAKEWVHFCTNLLKEPNAYVILGGDLINNCTRSSVSNIFDEVMRPREQKRLMVEMLSMIRSRILLACSGNHERRSGKDADDDPSYDIMCKLDLEHLYRENMAFVKIAIGEQNGNGAYNPTYSLCVTHGAGGGILTGAGVNRTERFAYVIDGVDAVITGHTHKPWISQPAKLRVDLHNNQVKVVPFKCISMTSWLSYGGYAAQKMLLPSSSALQKITLAGNKKQLTVEM